MHTKIAVYNFFEYIVAFLLLLQCQSIFLNTYEFGQLIAQGSTVFTVLLFIISAFKLIYHRIDCLNLLLWIGFELIAILIFSFVEYYFVKSFQPNPTLYFLISIIMFTVYIYYIIENKSFKNSIFSKIVNIVTFLSIISLLFFVFYLIGIQPNMSIYSRWTDLTVKGYSYIHFITQYTNIGGISILRNSGLFAEPSIYGYILTVAFLIQILVIGIKNKKDVIKAIIIGITMLTTTSTTGIVISIISVCLWYVLNKHNIGLYALGIPFITICYLIVKSLYGAKKSVDIYSSYAVRMNDISACIQAWKNNIFLGTGLDNNSEIIPHFYLYRIQIHFFGLSTGLFAVLAYGGIFMLMFYLLPSVVVFFKNKSAFIIAAMLIFYLVYAMVQMSYLYAFMIAYFWALIITSKEKEKIS